MATRPYSLLRNVKDVDHAPWLELFHTWAQQVGATPGWPDEAHAGGWRVRLTLNNHPVPNYIGNGKTKKQACADLVRQLEGATPPILTIPLLPAFRA